MAVYEWNGTTDSAWGTATNFSPSGTPVNNDTVNVVDGTVAIDGSDTAADLDLFGVGPKYAATGGIGSAAAYLLVAADVMNIHIAAPCGDVYIDSDEAGPDTTDLCTVRNETLDKTVYLKGDFTTINVQSGRVKLVSGSAVTVNIAWDKVGPRPEVEIVAMNVSSELNCYSDCVPTITGSATVATVNVGPCTVTNDKGTITNYYMWNASSLVYHNNGDVTLIVAGDGFFDATRDPRAKTFSTVRTFNGTVDKRNQSGNIIITNPVQEYGTVGKVIG